MKLNIEIETDNAAFDDYPRREVTRILRELAAKTERGIYYDGRDVPLYDPEGNKMRGIRMPNELWEATLALATDNQRSGTKEIIIALQEHLKRSGYQEKTWA